MNFFSLHINTTYIYIREMFSLDTVPLYTIHVQSIHYFVCTCHTNVPISESRQTLYVGMVRTRHARPFQTHNTYSTSASVPTKTFKAHKIHSYNDIHWSITVCSSSSSSFQMTYHKSRTHLDFTCIFLVFMILDQQNLCIYTINFKLKNFLLFVVSHFLFKHVRCTHQYKG